MSIEALSGNYVSNAVYTPQAPVSKVDSAVEALQGEEKKSKSQDTIEISEEGRKQASKNKGLRDRKSVV